MDFKLKKELADFFMLFGAKNSLTEPNIEKLQRIIHELSIKNFELIKLTSAYIVEKDMMERPEDEILDDIRYKGFSEIVKDL